MALPLHRPTTLPRAQPRQTPLLPRNPRAPPQQPNPPRRRMWLRAGSPQARRRRRPFPPEPVRPGHHPRLLRPRPRPLPRPAHRPRHLPLRRPDQTDPGAYTGAARQDRHHLRLQPAPPLSVPGAKNSRGSAGGGLRNRSPGSAIVGRQLGAPAAGHYDGLTTDTQIYMHDVESFRRFWREVGASGSLTGFCNRWRRSCRGCRGRCRE